MFFIHTVYTYFNKRMINFVKNKLKELISHNKQCQMIFPAIKKI
jgi:hypothetical protein